MGRDYNKEAVLRRSRTSSKPQKFIIYVEGRNTEKSYLEKFKKTNVTPVVVRGHGIASCLAFLEESEKHFNRLPSRTRNSYTQRWLMFDYDGRADFGEAVKEARKKGFKVAFSSMCIEYWFLLHFENHSGEPIPQQGDSHSQSQINMINRHLRKYNKSAKIPVAEYESDNKTIQDDLFDLMMAINPETKNPRIVDAINRAKNMHTSKKDCGQEFNESVTSIYELLEALGVSI